GTNVSWTGGLTVNGTSITNVLYNFYQATQLTIQGIDIRGSLLAPFADVNFVSGVINGQMICKSLSGMGQMNLAQFIGNIPFEKEITNIATITSTVTTDPNPNNNSASATITVSNIEQGNNNGSENQNNWQYVNGFSNGEIVYAMAYDESGNIYAGTWGGNIYKSSNGGQTWLKINNNMNVGFIWALNIHNGYIFAATELGVFKYDGSAWSLTSLSNIDVHALASDNGVLYAGTWGLGVYKSTDNGTTWNEMNNGLGYNLIINALTVHSNILYAASYGGGVFKYQNSTWTKLNVGYDFVWSLASNSNGLYAGTYGDGLYRSLDNGTTWTKVNNLNASFIYSIAVNLSDKIYVASWTSGVFESTDNGNTWNSIGMGGFGVSALIVTKNSDNVFVGTKEGKIYLSKRVASVTSVESEEIPTKFELSQNYPNPFNPVTTIKFAVPEKGRYTLKVYDILGQEVATLFDDEMNAGIQKLTFNGSNLSSGIYIYRLIGNNVNISKKMILMK
ncbi:MAG: choice-of-anchor A family protein, partial [Melioribacter sp.]|nr:choice-of-anchor A family protein [Melioribacter sp.]